MPIHDWSRVDAGTFHDFHHSWITHLKETLNAGVLPSPFYAMSQQLIGSFETDVLTLDLGEPEPQSPMPEVTSGVLLADSPPKVTYRTVIEEADAYTLRQRSVVIRHRSNRRIVAVIEVVSAGNKSSTRRFQQFIEKIQELIERGIHLLVIDLQPRGSFDPHGIHAAIADAFGMSSVEDVSDRPLTLVSYRADRPIEAFVEPTAVGLPLAPMPLFLSVDRYVSAPLEASYKAAWEGTAAVVREQLAADLK